MCSTQTQICFYYSKTIIPWRYIFSRSFPTLSNRNKPKVWFTNEKKISQSPLFCGIPVQICGGPLCADAAPAVDDITDKWLRAKAIQHSIGLRFAAVWPPKSWPVPRALLPPKNAALNQFTCFLVGWWLRNLTIFRIVNFLGRGREWLTISAEQQHAGSSGEILFKSQILRWPRTATSLLWCNFSVLAVVTRHKLFLFWPSKLRILLPHYFISFRKDTHFEQE